MSDLLKIFLNAIVMYCNFVMYVMYNVFVMYENSNALIIMTPRRLSNISDLVYSKPKNYQSTKLKH